MILHARTASTWFDGHSDVILLHGPVRITLDTANLSADGAVIWLTDEPGGVLPAERAEIALIGNAQLTQPALGVTRSGDYLFVTTAVRGDIALVAQSRTSAAENNTPLFLNAQSLRQGGGLIESIGPASRPVLQPSTENPAALAPGQLPSLPSGYEIAPGKAQRMHFHYESGDTVPDEDHLIFELQGDVEIVDIKPDGDYLEMRAARAVIFTSEPPNALLSPRDLDHFADKVTGVYLEGDVRIDYDPAPPSQTGQPPKPEQRMDAARIYYDVKNEQAVVTDVVLYTDDPSTGSPVVIRAEHMRQLAVGEYEAQKAQVSTSSFENPSYSINTDEIYINQTQVPVPYEPGRMETNSDFVAQGDELQLFGVPAFYVSQASGNINNDPFPLRTISAGEDNVRGIFLESVFGLFELAGRPHPRDLDISLETAFYAQRGPGFGIDGKYQGTNIDTDTREITDYNGDFNSFLITDHGTDVFYDDRSNVDPPDQIRGKVQLEHNEFFDDNWQAQFRIGYVSDPTYLEEYYPQQFFEDDAYDAEFYFKRQQDTEAITFGGSFDTNRFVTTVDQVPDQFDVEDLPSLGYRRTGDALADDTMTLFSQNTVDRLRFDPSHYSLAQQGYVYVTPGLPNAGWTGDPSSVTYREDSRQEVDFPLQIGQIKADPYVIGRATEYSNSPDGDAQTRMYGGTGVRFTTDFWKVYDDVDNDLLDIHRLRHIIEPEINLYTSAETVDRDQLFIYQNGVDDINAISAADFELHQRWETYRGGPGHEQSVDFLDWNIDATAYTNPPKDPGIDPIKFHGLFFPFEPETSIPRDSVNSDLTWLISDSTAFLANAEYNSDHSELATASAGFAVNRDPRLSYYVGVSYIEQLNSDIATFGINYTLNTKYKLMLSQSYDFGQSKDAGTSLTVERNLDKLICDVTVYHDSFTGANGVQFNLYPEGLGPAPQAGDVGNLFGNDR
ncbi:MAG TPA: LPS assembly protein LptD [Tepidisphaeraceae bacterium]|nr:LPS assembly protein LptD [Tepidisphaeraceae bacterium]